jgi:hypothetical protein
VTVIINDAVLEPFLRSQNGPVGLDLARRAHNVEERARQNAAGQIIGIRTGDLIGGITSRIEADVAGLFAVISTPAKHRGFGYPAFWDQRGRPWLTTALREGFR